MQFVWAYYPNYSYCPHTILDWLITEARRIAHEELLAKQIEQNAYGAPQKHGNNNYSQNDYDEEY
jgi:hypothetical protein